MSIFSHHSTYRDPGLLSWSELIQRCAHDREDSLLWKEFLRRYGHRINQFIRGTWRRSCREGEPGADNSVILEGVQQSDLFQSTIVRLVENGCTVIKAFSGASEDEWLAYLAVITRSVVRDALRLQRALKRPGGTRTPAPPMPDARAWEPASIGNGHDALEREVLAREVHSLCERTIQNLAGADADRDMLIFRLYFIHDLSTFQISRCRGVNLSKAGVAKVIHRWQDRVRSVVSGRVSEAVLR